MQRSKLRATSLLFSVLLLPSLAFGIVVDNLKISTNTISALNTNGDVVLAPAGTGKVKNTSLTVSRVPYIDASGYFVSSTTSGTELQLLTGVTGTLLTATNTATVTNKTFTAPILNAPIIDAASLTEQGSTPATPSAGTKKLYAKNDGKVYTLNSSGTETEVGAGGGGGINYITNGDAEAATTGWATFKDAAASRPVDGTGGTATVVSWSRSTSSPLRGVGSFLYTKTASNAQGEGVSYAFSTDDASKGRSQIIEVDYSVVSGTFVAGSTSADSDVIIYLYDVTNSQLIEPSGIKLFSNSTTIADQFKASFQAPSNSTSFRLIIFSASTSAAAYTLKFDNVKTYPGSNTYGTPVTDWAVVPNQPITGSGGGTLNIGTGGGAIYTTELKQVGDEALIKYKLRLGTSGATNVTGAYIFPMPAGLTMHSSIITYDTVGYGDITSIGSANPVARIVAKVFGGGFIIDVSDSALDNSGSTLLYNNNNYVSLTVRVKIQGWSSSVRMSDGYEGRDISMQVEAASAPTGTIASSFASATTISWGTPSKDTVSGYSSGAYTVKTSGDYIFKGQTAISGAYTSLGFAGISVAINGAEGQSYYQRVESSGTTSFFIPFNFTLNDLKAGDVITFRGLSSATTPTFQSISKTHFLSITKNSNPQTIAANEAITAIYSTAAGASIASNTNTIVDFLTKIKDTHGAVTTGAGVWKFTAPRAADYQVNASLYMGATSAAVSDFQINVYINGAAFQGANFPKGGTSSAPLAGNTAFTIPLNAGDTLDIRIYQNTGSALSLITSGQFNWVSITAK